MQLSDIEEAALLKLLGGRPIRQGEAGALEDLHRKLCQREQVRQILDAALLGAGPASGSVAADLRP
jgi:hypothetical protein